MFSAFATGWHVLAITVGVLRIAIPAAIAARILYAVLRFAVMPWAAKVNYPAACWHSFRWRWLCSNLGLAYRDQHRRAAQPIPLSVTSVKTTARGSSGRLRYPRARIRADAFGLVATVRTIPKVGRAELEKHAPWIADAWRCHRVQISQPRPGRLIVRGLRLDPLTLPLSMGQAPPGVYGTTSVQGATNVAVLGKSRRSALLAKASSATNVALSGNPEPLRLYVGRDEWGVHRWLTLPGITGVTVGGLPGYGKTAFINSLLCQLAGLPVQLILIDGKGSFDYADWEQRAWISTGDELPAAAAALEDAHSLMRHRFGTVLEQTGHRNAWHAPLSDRFPVVLTVIDECHTFFDLEAVKGQKEAEGHVRTCRTMAGQLVKKGRSVLMITVFITQKQTSDAIPTAIRDNCTIGLSFATKTTDASVAALGQHIKEHPSFDPVTLQARPDYIGVCTVSLPTGADPFVRLRVPEVTEEAAAARAAETVSLRLDPRAIPAPVLPAEIPAPATVRTPARL